METTKMKAGWILATIILFLGASSFAQEDEKTKVHLKVLKNDEVTKDTTFFIEKGSDQLKNILHDLAGVDSDIILSMHKHDDVHLSDTKKTGDTTDVAVWKIITSEGDEKAIDIEIEEKDGNYVMIKKKVKGETGEYAMAHAYAKVDKIWIDKNNVIVEIDTVDVKAGEKGEKRIRVKVKTGDGETKDIWIDKEGGDFVLVTTDEVKVGKDHERDYYIVKSGKKPGKEGEYKKAVKVMKSKDGNVIILEGDTIHQIHDTIHIKMNDHDHKLMFIEENEEGGKARVIVKKGDKDFKYVSKGGDKFDVFVIESDDGTIIEKKVKVMKKKSEGEEGEIEITIEIEEGKEKEAKESGEKKVEKEKKEIKSAK